MSRIYIPISLPQYFSIFKHAQEIHAQLAEPIPELMADNIPKIETALNQPFQVFGGEQLYKGFCKKAAILFYLIIDNHVMINGNKRMACLSLSFFCVLNKYYLDMPEKNLRNLAKQVASPHQHEEMLLFVEKNIRRYIKPFKFRGYR